MPRPRPPHLHREITRHGRTTWYVRVGKGPRVRLRSAFGTPEFQSEYQDAIAGKVLPKDKGHAAGTLAWLVARYRESSAWAALSNATRRQRENILRQILETAGNESFARIGRKAIVAGRERRAKTPFQARHFVMTMRALFRWAVDAEHCKVDPTEGVAASKPETEGFAAWTDDEVERFEERWPIGTRERVMFDIFRFTGLRRGDTARLGRQHVRNGVIEITTEKTGTRVAIPMLPELERTLKVGPTGELAFIVAADGQPMRKEVVGNLFRVACRESGVGKSAHGLRKYAAARMAANGATVAQIEAVFGWEGGRMASHYTKSVDRSRLAAMAIKKIR